MCNTACTSKCTPQDADVSKIGAFYHSALVQMQDHIQESFKKKCTFSLWFTCKPFHGMLVTKVRLLETFKQ